MAYVDLMVDTTIAGQNISFDFTVNLDETSNSANPCPYNYPADSDDPTINANGCSDRTTFPDSFPNQSIDIGGVLYTLEIIGFEKVASGVACPLTPTGTPIANFVTKEATRSDACLYAKVVEVLADITPSCEAGLSDFRADPAVLAGRITKQRSWRSNGNHHDD